MSDETQEAAPPEDRDPDEEEVQGFATNLNSSKSNLTDAGGGLDLGLGVGPSDLKAKPEPPKGGER